MQALALVAALAASATQPARQVRVVDGDTIHARVEGRRERVRLLRVNTPEMSTTDGAAAAADVAALLTDCALELEPETERGFDRDPYGRILAYVWCGGANVNVELVRRGRSVYWQKYGRGRHAKAFAVAAEEARTARRGIWAGK